METVPQLFLSVKYEENDGDNKGKIKSVFLWQFNKKCPCKTNSEFILTDTRCHQGVFGGFNTSLLLHAKIIPMDNEEIIEARFVGDSKLLIKSGSIHNEEKSGPFKLIYRVYDIENFYDTFWVNPVHQEAIANEFYTWKFEISSCKSKDGEMNWEVKLWKRKAIEETEHRMLEIVELGKQKTINTSKLDVLIDTVSYKVPIKKGKLNEKSFSELIEAPIQKSVIVFDKATSLILYVNNFDVCFIYLGKIHSFKCFNYTLAYKTKQGGIFHFEISTFPMPTLNQLNTSLAPQLLAEDHFEWKIVEFWDISIRLTTLNIVYYYNKVFFIINLHEKDSRPRVLLDLTSKIKDNKPISWDFTEPTEETSVLSFIYEEILYIYNPKTLKYHSTEFFPYKENKNSYEWKIHAKFPGMIVIHNANKEIKHMSILKVYYESDPKSFFNKEKFNPVIKHYEEERRLIQRNEGIQIGGGNGKIFLAKLKEPMYEDKTHYVYEMPRTSFGKPQLPKYKVLEQPEQNKNRIKVKINIEREEKASSPEFENIKIVKDNLSSSKNLKELNKTTEETIEHLKTKLKEQIEHVKNTKRKKRSVEFTCKYDSQTYCEEYANEVWGAFSKKVDDLEVFIELKNERKKMKKVILRELGKEKDKKKKVKYYE